MYICIYICIGLTRALTLYAFSTQASAAIVAAATEARSARAAAAEAAEELEAVRRQLAAAVPEAQVNGLKIKYTVG